MDDKNNLMDRYSRFVEGCELLEKDVRYKEAALAMHKQFDKELFNAGTKAFDIIDKYERMYLELVNSLRTKHETNE